MLGLFKRKPHGEIADTGTIEATAAAGLKRLHDLKRRKEEPQGPSAIVMRGAVVEALKVLEAALTAVDRITALLGEAHETIDTAKGAKESPIRAMLADRYDDLRGQIDATALNASGAGVNLLSGARIGIELALEGTGQGTVAVRSIDLSAAGLGLPAPASGFEDKDEIARIESAIAEAETRLTRAAHTFVTDAALLSRVFATLPMKAPGADIENSAA